MRYSRFLIATAAALALSLQAGAAEVLPYVVIDEPIDQQIR